MERQYRPEHGASAPEQHAKETRAELDGFITRARRLQGDLQQAPAREARRVAPLSEGEKEAYRAETEQIDPAYDERYEAADLLLSAAIAVLEDGLDGQRTLDEDPRYLREKLNSALGQYGLEVRPTEEMPVRRQERAIRRARRLYQERRGDTLPIETDQ